ncbi:oligopeptide/dipeptide ABC transporter ATP-binding protein [Salinibacterium hongtaonis]|uniref:oligopeptide/dipeptide ABC transporter ATP-binding protein n=1 Tax=Homoserinimonas hongtaonis TaxID=2079791 RepID=UPI0018EE4F2F|nr:ABC transporter ATP-binding protein [Salinibacterium hongtaonis]
MNDTTTLAPAAGPGATIDAALDARGITVDYKTRRTTLRAVDGVDLVVRKGETLGLVGESGSGKSSIGKSIAQLPPPTGGSVIVDGVDITRLRGRRLRLFRRRLQMIFQDPISSLNPRRTALDIVAEPLRLAKHPNPRARAAEILAEVGVDAQMASRRPHELSGGQCQRIAIARAVVQEPELLICDEPVSALDVSVQAAVLNILEKMKADYSLSMIFISHDLAVVSNISDRVAVLYLGQLCEVAPSTELYAAPRHHYTNLLLSSVPRPGVTREPATTVSPTASSPTVAPAAASPSAKGGCPFSARCPAATGLCIDTTPEYRELAPDHFVACHHPVEV